MRDDIWLNAKLDSMWEFLFNDIERKNNVIIRFKGRWKNKFGHIKLLPDKSSEIAVNSFLKDERVPEYIIDLTIAHELSHYAHGFNSPLPRKYSHPHKGGVVTKELKRRGFGFHIRKERLWMKREWREIIKEKLPEKKLQFNLFRFR